MAAGTDQKSASVARSLLQRAREIRTETMRLVDERMTEVRRLLTDALKFARQAGSAPETIEALKALGQVERDAGAHAKALTHYEEATKLARSVDDDLLLAHTIRHAGDIHLDAGHVRRAEPLYREALEIYRRHPESKPLDVANALRSMALLKERTGQDATAIWADARELYKVAGAADGIIESTAHMGGARR